MSTVTAPPPEVARFLDPRDGTIRVFTFWLADTAYAVSIQNIHSVVQDDQDIRTAPSDDPGLLGTVWYQGAPVPVYDFAHRLETQSGRQAKQALIQQFNDREAEHVAWVEALERAVRENAAFTGTRDPVQSKFGQWYSQFETRDPVLQEIVAQFDEPHRRMHGLADELVGLCQSGKEAEALETFELERITTLRRMRTLFAEARDQLREMSRTVLLFLTDNGQTPKLGLRIDGIDDVVSFGADMFVPADRVSLTVKPVVRQMLLGYLKEGGREAILIQPTAGF